MENVFMISNGLTPARTQSQQLKLVMNLPVRVIAEGKEMDILPLSSDEFRLPAIAKKMCLKSTTEHSYFTTNEMIDFFCGSEKDDLLFRYEVCLIYNIGITTLKTWVKKGIVKRYLITPNLSLYKRSELPSVTELFGPFEYE